MSTPAGNEKLSMATEINPATHSDAPGAQSHASLGNPAIGNKTKPNDHADDAKVLPDDLAAKLQALISTVQSLVVALDGPDEDNGVRREKAAAQTKKKKSRLFGLLKQMAAPQNADDYEQKYPADAYGEEMGPSARVWRTYLDEAQKADAELVEGWRDTTDVLLVFAGLFSAVLATFIGLTTSNLQPDYSQITASLLVEQNALLRATANHISVDSIPPSTLSSDSDFVVANHDRWVNGLWFTSLSVSLVAAFMAVLVKQWIQHYVFVVSGTPRDQVRIRQFRFLGVEQWHMPLIIGILPMLLHLALLLYFAGLVLFLWPLDAPIAYTTFVIAILAYGFYAVSNVLPLWYPICPYKTPLSSLLAAALSSLHAPSSILLFMLRSCYHIFIQWLRRIFHAKPLDDTFDDDGGGEEGTEGHSAGHRALYHMKEAEKRAATKQGDEVDAEALVWLYSTSSNPTVTSVTVQAISGLRLGFFKPARRILQNVITFDWNSVEGRLLRNLDYSDQHGRREDDRTKVERLLRSCHQLEARLEVELWKHTQDMIANTSGLALEVLHACHSMLDGCRFSYRKEPETPLAALDSYNYEETCTPFMWSVLLKRCQSENFDDPLQRWMHGIRVLHNLPDLFDYDEPLRYSMVLEYLCSCSSNNAGWGEHSVLDGSPFCVEKVLPRIYSALSEALRVLCAPRTSETEMTSNDPVPHPMLPPVLGCILNFVRFTLERNVGPVEREAITKAASALRLEMQKLLEPERLRENEKSSKQMSKLCDVLHNPLSWPRWIPPWTISWTPELMDCFLRSYGLRDSWADSSFYEGSPGVYRLFEEKDGLSKVHRDMHELWFCTCYLEGLIGWKADPDDKQQHINILFAPKNFARIIEEFIVKRQDDGTYKAVHNYYSPLFVGTLFRIRSPNPETYGEFFDPFLKLMKDHPNLWPPKPEPTGAEPEAFDSENKPRCKRFFSTGAGTLLRWILCQDKTGGQTDPEKGAEPT